MCSSSVFFNWHYLMFDSSKNTSQTYKNQMLVSIMILFNSVCLTNGQFLQRKNKTQFHMNVEYFIHRTMISCANRKLIMLSISIHAFLSVNGGWQITGNWSNWSTCSKTCNGGIRKRARGRSCTNPKPQYGGASCAGSIKEISYESCNTLMCPSKYEIDFYFFFWYRSLRQNVIKEDNVPQN